MRKKLKNSVQVTQGKRKEKSSAWHLYLKALLNFLQLGDGEIASFGCIAFISGN